LHVRRLYGRQGVFENDVGVIFHKYWILIGVVSDVPEPGSVDVVDIGYGSRRTRRLS